MIIISNNRISRALYPLTLAITLKIKEKFGKVINSKRIGRVSLRSVSLTGVLHLSSDR